MWADGEVFGYEIYHAKGEFIEGLWDIYGSDYAEHLIDEQLAYYNSLQPTLYEGASSDLS